MNGFTGAGAGADPPRSTRVVVLVPFAVCTLIWGSTWIVIRDQLGVVPPSWSVAYRFVIAGFGVAAWAWWRGDSWRLGLRGLGFAALIGSLQFCANFNFVYRAEHFITSGLVAVVFALLLVPNAILARLFLGQRLGRQLIVGSGVAMAGVVLLFVNEARVDPSAGPAVAAGIALTLGGVASASVANVLQATPTADRYPMGSTLAVAMWLGAGFDGAIAWATAGPPVFDPRPGYIAGMAYLGLVASSLAFPLYFGLLRRIGPAKAAYSSVIVPVIAMLLSTLFEGYRWAALAVAGAVLTGIGLVVALRARRPA